MWAVSKLEGGEGLRCSLMSGIFHVADAIAGYSAQCLSFVGNCRRWGVASRVFSV